jgi:hypothetical protein
MASNVRRSQSPKLKCAISQSFDHILTFFSTYEQAILWLRRELMPELLAYTQETRSVHERGELKCVYQAYGLKAGALSVMQLTFDEPDHLTSKLTS